MRSPQLVVLTALAAVLVRPRGGGLADAACTHLVLDPEGDVTTGAPAAAAPAPVDDVKQVDLAWTDLRTTRTALVATIGVADLNPESQPALDHEYLVTFSNGSERFTLQASFNRTGNDAFVAHRIAGDDSAPDDEGDASSANEVIGDATATLDRRKDTFTISAPLSVFAGVHRLTGSLTLIKVMSASGGSAAKAGVYGADDVAHTTKAYRMGMRPCAS